MIRPVRPLIRAAWRFVLWSFVILAQMPAAQAHILCMKIDQLNSVTEGPIRRKIEEHLAARYAPVDAGIFQLTDQYFIAQPARSNCVDYSCRYLLLQFRDGNVEEKLAFAGTGWIWLFASPQETYQPHSEAFTPRSSSRVRSGHLSTLDCRVPAGPYRLRRGRATQKYRAVTNQPMICRELRHNS